MGRRNKKKKFLDDSQYNQYNQYGQYNNQYYNQNGQYYNQNYNQNNQYYNNQYYNQNQYPQYNQGYGYQQDDKKKKNFKMDKKMLIGIISAVVFVILLIATIAIISNGNGKKDNEVDDNPPEVVSDTRVIGNDTYGYLTIPSEWIRFQDKSSSKTMQYSDKDTTYIVVLYAVPTNQTSALQYKDAAYDNLVSSGTTIEVQEVQFANYYAYQIYGFNSTKNSWVSAWFFEAEDGYTHYVGIEGPDKDNEYFQIPFTFKLKK